jgi:hypothetical protein
MMSPETIPGMWMEENGEVAEFQYDTFNTL